MYFFSNVPVDGFAAMRLSTIHRTLELSTLCYAFKYCWFIFDLADAVLREIYEETGLRTTFKCLLGLRESNGLPTTFGTSEVLALCHLTIAGSPAELQDQMSLCKQVCVLLEPGHAIVWVFLFNASFVLVGNKECSLVWIGGNTSCKDVPHLGGNGWMLVGWPFFGYPFDPDNQ